MGRGQSHVTIFYILGRLPKVWFAEAKHSTLRTEIENAI